MDPFIENQWWRNFHSRMIPEVADLLAVQIRPRYLAVVEEHVYLTKEPDIVESRIPDVSVLRTDTDAELAADSWPEGDGPATAIAPALRTLSLPEQTRELYLTIREHPSLRVVTTIEVLSPTNKDGPGRREYLAKRAEILESQSHLVEIDLLRGGRRMPTEEPLPPGDYYAFVCRQQLLPQAQVYAWTLHQTLPCFPVPLAGSDADVPLDLQAAFTAVYDRAGFDLLLDYTAPLTSPVRQADEVWLRKVLEAR
jgi:hypothetical protein